MPEEFQPVEWIVEYEKDAFYFKDFVTALSYADAVAFKHHLLRVIEPSENRIRLIPNQAAPGMQVQPVNR